MINKKDLSKAKILVKRIEDSISNLSLLDIVEEADRPGTTIMDGLYANREEATTVETAYKEFAALFDSTKDADWLLLTLFAHRLSKKKYGLSSYKAKRDGDELDEVEPLKAIVEPIDPFLEYFSFFINDGDHYIDVSICFKGGA